MSKSRFREILEILSKYQLDWLLVKSGVRRSFRGTLHKEEMPDISAQAVNIRLALEELGPAFIKLGQFLSNRPNMFPLAVLEELQKLQDQVPPFPGHEALEILTAELGKPLDELFDSVCEEPAASASLAQVHYARLKDGTDIVLKIQRPDIKPVILQDMAVMRQIARLMDKRFGWEKSYSFTDWVDEFERTLGDELDFEKEARSYEILTENLSGFPNIAIPRVHREITTKKVLALDRIFGARLNPERVETIPKDVRRSLARELLDAYLKQIIEDGFFHADPHLGNLLLEENEENHRLALIDLGVVGQLDSQMRFEVAELFLAFANMDTERAVNVLVRIGGPCNSDQRKTLEQNVREILTARIFTTAADFGLGEIIFDLAQAAIKNGLFLPQSVNLLCKTLCFTDAIIKQLDPELDYKEFIRDSSSRIFMSLLTGQFNTGRFIDTFFETSRLVLDSSARMNVVLDKLVRDELTIKFEHMRLGGVIQSLSLAFSRLAMAVIVSAIVIGSGMVMSIPTKLTFLGYPILGLSGFLLAGLFGFYLLISILRTWRSES